MRTILIIIIVILFGWLMISCEKETTQYNDWLLGKWQIEKTNEYIQFYSNDLFIMNDTLNGSYEVQEKNDKELWFYVISDSEEYEEDGEMIFSDIIYHKEMTVGNLPLHNGETLKIYYTK